MPDLSAFPREDWAWAVREACRTVAVADLDYGDPRGDPRLREVLAGYAGRVRAAVTDRDHVLVCSGFAQGATLVLRTLARAGYRRIALENPGNGDPARSASSRAALRIGGELLHVPVDGHGVDVDALAASGAQVVVVTPAHQSPTGVVLTAERQARAGRAGRAPPTASSSRTTTTPSSATTATRSACCRASRPSGCSRSAR